MTENFAALRVLQQHLLRDEDEPPFVLFGSSFPKDMEYTQVKKSSTIDHTKHFTVLIVLVLLISSDGYYNYLINVCMMLQNCMSMQLVTVCF